MNTALRRRRYSIEMEELIPSVEKIKKQIVDWSIAENQLIQWRSHGGLEYLFAFPEFVSSEAVRKLSITALKELLDEKVIRVEFELLSAEVTLKLYDLTFINFEKTADLNEAEHTLLTGLTSAESRILRHGSSLPPFVESGRTFNDNAEMRVTYLTALEQLIVQKKVVEESESSTESTKSYRKAV